MIVFILEIIVYNKLLNLLPLMYGHQQENQLKNSKRIKQALHIEEKINTNEIQHEFFIK